MGQYQSVFQRREVKYLLDERQYRALGQVLVRYLVPDEFFQSAISNLYYDTPDFRLIRQSLEKPTYKEKLRLRCYAVPGEDTQAFLEIKKKCNGMVYKRRASLPYSQALAYLAGEGPGDGGQIFQELGCFLQFYQRLVPAMVLSSDRISLKGKDDDQLRLTFDRNILWRADHLDLAQGTWGEPLLRPGQHLMEIKVLNAMPLWLAATLSELAIYPTSFSKYGAAYQTWLRGGVSVGEGKRYA